MVNFTQLDDKLCSRVWVQSIKSTRKDSEKIGIEMEMHAYDAQTLSPIGTSSSKIEIQAFLKRIVEVSNPLKIKYDESSSLITDIFFKEGGNVSVEPGGQIEFSSAPFEKISDLVTNVVHGLKIIETASEGNLVFLSHGTNPIALDDHPLLLPKERYQIMTRYFQSAPQLRGIDMMRHTATVQANLDIFGDKNWQDAVNLTLILIPLTRHLFANSKFFKNKKIMSYSERQEIWKKMDPSRSRIPAQLLFAENIECAYAQWAKKAYVFFIEGLPIHEQPLYQELTFEEWFKNGYKGTRPTVESWENHLATLFPDLRLRDFLEIRHIDAQPFEHSLAPVAFFYALLKNNKTRRNTWKILKKFHIDLNNIKKADINNVDISHFLLDYAEDVLHSLNETAGMKAVSAYRRFISQKEDYWQEIDAFNFVRKNVTSKPSIDFLKFLV
jgi:glutamate--cysteine ligase